LPLPGWVVGVIGAVTVLEVGTIVVLVEAAVALRQLGNGVQCRASWGCPRRETSRAVGGSVTEAPRKETPQSGMAARAESERPQARPGNAREVGAEGFSVHTVRGVWQDERVGEAAAVVVGV